MIPDNGGQIRRGAGIVNIYMGEDIGNLNKEPSAHHGVIAGIFFRKSQNLVKICFYARRFKDIIFFRYEIFKKLIDYICLLSKTYTMLMLEILSI